MSCGFNIATNANVVGEYYPKNGTDSFMQYIEKQKHAHNMSFENFAHAEFEVRKTCLRRAISELKATWISLAYESNKLT